LDERLGEIILSKALGFALVVLFLGLAGRRLRDIGLHSRGLAPSLIIGASVALLALVAGYAIELLALGSNASLQFAAIDPKAGVSGGFLFALWLVSRKFRQLFHGGRVISWGYDPIVSYSPFLLADQLAASHPVWRMALTLGTEMVPDRHHRDTR
jgi:hypothetical protein